MKTINKLFCTLFVLTTIVACDLEKITSLQDDLKIYVNPDAVGNKKEITVYDAVTGEPITSPQVTFSGEYASEVYTSDGYADITFDQGETVIGIKHGVVTPTSEAPINIDAELSATGYLSKSKTLKFDGTPVSATEIYLIPTTGLANVKTATDTKPEGEAITVLTTSADGGENLAEIELPAETTFKDKDGNAKTGSLTLGVETFELGADSGTDSGFNILDEVPETTTESGDVIIPTNLIKIQSSIDGENVIPSEIKLTIEAGSSLFLVLPNGLTIEIPAPAAKGHASTTSYSFNIEALLRNSGLSEADILTALAYYANNVMQLLAGTTVSENDICENKTISVKNSGASGKYTFVIKEGSVTKFSKTETIFAGKSLTITGVTLPASASYTLKITVSTINGVKTIKEQSLSCDDLSNVIELENNSEYPSETKTIDQNIECDGVVVALTNTNISYRKFDSNSDIYYIYGVVVDGKIIGKVPVLEASTGYKFKLYYSGQKSNNEPILGSKINAGIIDDDDIDKICDEVN